MYLNMIMNVYVDDIHGFAEAITKIDGQIIGIDYGLSYIGTAISDRSNTIAFADQVIRNDKDHNRIMYIIESNNLKGCVIGLPKILNGKGVHELYNKIKILIQQIIQKDINVLLLDERMSTRGAISEINTNIVGFKNTKIGKLSTKSKRDDHQAARYILQNALDSINRII